MSSKLSPPIIFNRKLLKTRLRKAAFKTAPDFIVKRAADDLLDRLLTIKRPFSRSLDISFFNNQFSDAIIYSGRTKPLKAGLISGDVIVDDEFLPFKEESFDLVVCGMNLQWVNDLPGTLKQIRRILAPDGLFIACLPGGLTFNEMRNVFIHAELEKTGGSSPRVHPFIDVRDMGALLQRGGFTLPVADVDSFTIRYDNLYSMINEIRQMTFSSVLHSVSNKNLTRDIIMHAQKLYSDNFSDDDGRLRLSFEIIWLSGWAAHDSQQEPAKPGSATHSLENAINITKIIE